MIYLKIMNFSIFMSIGIQWLALSIFICFSQVLWTMNRGHGPLWKIWGKDWKSWRGWPPHRKIHSINLCGPLKASRDWGTNQWTYIGWSKAYICNRRLPGLASVGMDVDALNPVETWCRRKGAYYMGEVEVGKWVGEHPLRSKGKWEWGAELIEKKQGREAVFGM